MTRIRQWALATALAVIVALSFSVPASADPSDPGHFGSTSTTTETTTTDGPGKKK